MYHTIKIFCINVRKSQICLLTVGKRQMVDVRLSVFTCSKASVAKFIRTIAL